LIDMVLKYQTPGMPRSLEHVPQFHNQTAFRYFYMFLADLIEEDHICRLVDDVVGGIDFKTMASI